MSNCSKTQRKKSEVKIKERTPQLWSGHYCRSFTEQKRGPEKTDMAKRQSLTEVVPTKQTSRLCKSALVKPEGSEKGREEV